MSYKNRNFNVEAAPSVTPCKLQNQLEVKEPWTKLTIVDWIQNHVAALIVIVNLPPASVH